MPMSMKSRRVSAGQTYAKKTMLRERFHMTCVPICLLQYMHIHNDEIIYCPNNAEVVFSKVLTMSENVVLQLFKETDQSGKHMHKVDTATLE
jgi:hypothetical protein